METPSPAPSRDEVDAWFVALIDGSRSRDDADRWVGQWITSGEAVADDVVWWAIGMLSGVDLRHGHGEPFLHGDEQIRDWLTEFRDRCAGTP